MAADSSLYSYGSSTAQTVDVTSDSARDLGTVDVQQINQALDITDDLARELGVVTVNGTAGVDIENVSNGALPTDLAVALNANDVMEVASPSPLDVSAAALDVSAATVPTEQQTPVGIEDSGQQQIDPATDQTAASIASAVGSETGLAFGRQTVAASGSREALNDGNNQPVGDGKAVAIQAMPGNSNPVYIGDSTVTTANGWPLQSGQVFTAAVADVSTIYVDADSGGDSVAWAVEVSA